MASAVMITMDDAILGHLRSAIDSQGSRLYEEPTLVRNILNDLCAPHNYPGEIRVLAGAAELRVPTALRDASVPLPPTLGDELIRRLRTNLALDLETARWAVRAWAWALNVTGLHFSPAPRKRQAPGAISHPGSAEALQRAARLADRAMELAASIPRENSRAVALGMAASALAATDADRAAQALGEAELLVESITDDNTRTRQRHDLSVAVAKTDPRRAERLALSVSGPLKDDALGWLATVLADTDLDRAQRVARLIDDENLRMHALAGLVEVMADGEPDRAERLARMLAGEYWMAEGLCRVAMMLTLDDPARAAALVTEAEEVACSVMDDSVRAAALSEVGRAQARLNPSDATRLFDMAERVGASVPDMTARSFALGSLAVALAVADTERALRLAESLADGWYAIGEIARALAIRAPRQALSLAQAISNETPHLADIAVALAAADPDCAQILAGSIKNERWKASALVGIARVQADSNPDRAMRLLEDVEGLVYQMTDDLNKVIALVDIAASCG
jgi:hypothetical protein